MTRILPCVRSIGIRTTKPAWRERLRIPPHPRQEDPQVAPQVVHRGPQLDPPTYRRRAIRHAALWSSQFPEVAKQVRTQSLSTGISILKPGTTGLMCETRNRVFGKTGVATAQLDEPPRTPSASNPAASSCSTFSLCVPDHPMDTSIPEEPSESLMRL